MNAPHDYDLICIGSGPAGQRAAVQSAKLGKRVAVVEKRRHVGGECLAAGTIPSKTLREAIRTLCLVLAHDRGLGFAAKAKPDVERLLERVGAVVETQTEVMRDQLQRNDINIILGEAAFESPHQLRIQSDEGTRILSAQKILVSVGSRPAHPPAFDASSEPVIVSDGMLNLSRIPKIMVVVGAGVIGIEYASMFAALGVRVTVVDRRRRALEFLDDEIADELVHQMRRQKVSFRFDERVSEVSVVESPTRQGMVVLESGKRLLADLVLFSVGRLGATNSLNLDAAGLKSDARGRLCVDANFQTSVPHIYAAGDVIGFPSLAATASEQGRLAASHMFGAGASPLDEHFPFGIYAIPEISMVGATERTLTEQRVPYETGLASFSELARGQIMGDCEGLLKMLFERDTHRLLGVHIIGCGATDLIHTGQAVLRLGGGLEYFLDNVFNYPTLAEAYKVAALDANNKLQQFELAQAVVA